MTSVSVVPGELIVMLDIAPSRIAAAARQPGPPGRPGPEEWEGSVVPRR